MKEVIKVLGMTRHIKTTPYNPRLDGQVEKQMATLKDQLAVYVNEHHDNWDEHLGSIAQSYRITQNDATGFTPFFMMYGREMAIADEIHCERL